MLYELDKGIFLRNLTNNAQIFLILIGFLAITLASLEEESFAQSSAPISIEANLDSEFLLQFNQSTEIKSEDMKITFLNVTSDSRCPSDVTCIWQGQAGIELDVQKEETSILPPLKQVKLGIEISCKPGLVMVTKYNGTPACVKPQTREKLIERGWALEDTNQNEPTTITQENNNQTIELN